MHRYSYNQDGSLLAVKNDGDTVTMASYTYTLDGLLASASFGNSRTLANTWDADSNRVQLNVAAGQYDFVYDVTAGIPAVIEEVNSGASSTTTAYYFGEPDGGLIARQDSSGLHYYHFDALGSTRMLTDSDGDITDEYCYDAYGALLAHDRLAGSIDQPYQYVGQLGYYTHWQEPDFGLLQLGVRFYDPEVARFTSRDPLWQISVSSYDYSLNNPMAYSDPSGRKPKTCGQMNKDIKGIANAVERHGREEDKSGCKGKLHPKSCFNLRDMIVNYLNAKCETAGDTLHKYTNFCRGVCTFYDRCKGRTWKHQGVIDDSELDAYYSKCQCDQ